MQPPPAPQAPTADILCKIVPPAPRDALMISVNNTTTFQSLQDAIIANLGVANLNGLAMKWKDDDNVLIRLNGQADWTLAFANAFQKQNERKITIMLISASAPPSLQAGLENLTLSPTLITLRQPISMGVFLFTSNAETSFDIPNEVPINARLVRIQLFLRCGGEGPSRSFNVRLHTYTNSGTPFYHHLRGARYQQAAISFTSSEVDFPLNDQMPRKLFVQSDDVERSSHGLEVSLVGWAANQN